MEKFFSFKQVDYLPEGHTGACYGMCRAITDSSIGDSIVKQNKVIEIAELIKNKTLSQNFIELAIETQNVLEQYFKETTALPLEKNTIYILGVTAKLSAGYFTKYSLASYLDIDSYFANHAVLLIGTDDGVVIFEPRAGVYVSNEDITKLNRYDIEHLVEQTVSDQQKIYLSEIEIGYRNPDPNHTFLSHQEAVNCNSSDVTIDI
ncbi:hypothetical protein L3V82_04070 [Thiotrichales bacterium 19S3-7]|nr:hypothetical protein [Thiotrichales bacterium 19S3-7]MCF6801851.1 hypothetical protein [Thiotrichales bacterium 19S3-11]